MAELGALQYRARDETIPPANLYVLYFVLFLCGYDSLKSLLLFIRVDETQNG